MTLKTFLGTHYFSGPFTSNLQLPHLSGVYIITTLDRHGNHLILDVGESNDICARVRNHDRTQQWVNNMLNGLYAWTHQCNEDTRMLIEAALRLNYKPVCGIR